MCLFFYVSDLRSDSGLRNYANQMSRFYVLVCLSDVFERCVFCCVALTVRYYLLINRAVGTVLSNDKHGFGDDAKWASTSASTRKHYENTLEIDQNFNNLGTY